MLIFCQKKFERTQKYYLLETFVTGGVYFVFENALAAKDFIDAYYQNRFSAIFAYELEKIRKKTA